MKADRSAPADHWPRVHLHAVVLGGLLYATAKAPLLREVLALNTAPDHAAEPTP